MNTQQIEQIHALFPSSSPSLEPIQRDYCPRQLHQQLAQEFLTNTDSVLAKRSPYQRMPTPTLGRDLQGGLPKTAEDYMSEWKHRLTRMREASIAYTAFLEANPHVKQRTDRIHGRYYPCICMLRTGRACRHASHRSDSCAVVPHGRIDHPEHWKTSPKVRDVFVISHTYGQRLAGDLPEGLVERWLPIPYSWYHPRDTVMGFIGRPEVIGTLTLDYPLPAPTWVSAVD